MQVQARLSAQQWAQTTYGEVRLGDQRRTERAVSMGAALAREPMASLPQQLGSHAASKAAYRFLQSAQSSYEQLIAPHLQQSQQAMRERATILLIQDLTEVDYQRHPRTTGLGPVGQGKHHGYLLQTVLAVDPQSTEVLGIAAQEPFLRQPAPAGESSAQRRNRQDKESAVWPRLVQRIGAAPASCRYVHVGDRGADMYSFLQQCVQQDGDFLVRVQHNRRVDLRVELAQEPIPSAARRHGKKRAAGQEPPRHLCEEVRSWPAQGQQTISLDGNQKRKGREARLCISWGQLRLWPPDKEEGSPLLVWVVRSWEAEPPEGVEALEWLLLSSLPVQEEEDAWQRVQWYRLRWIVEDYHQCLKTGCALEERQLQSYEGLRTLLGFLAPLAVRLLQLRALVHQEPERAAAEVLEEPVVRVVAHLAQVAPSQLSLRAFWHRVAQVGGYLGRTGDGEPGWKTLWKGWLHIQTLLEGVQLASQLFLE
jgi:hypothetical protein